MASKTSPYTHEINGFGVVKGERNKPRAAMAFSTASRVSRPTGASPFSTRLTVLAETPALRATS
jgi:hypothetical protein